MKRGSKLNDHERLDLVFDLINAFSIVKKPADTAFFLQDVLTASEIRNLSIRLRIAKLLLAGKTYREIQELTKTSSATITKINAWIERGGDGFKKVIEKLPLKYKYPTKLSRGPIEYHMPEAIFKLVQYGIASSQEKRLKGFVESTQGKERFDKKFKENASEFYIRKKDKDSLKKLSEKFNKKRSNKTL